MRNQIRNGYRHGRQDRMKRARWWFNRMRTVVDLAMPVRPLNAPRPEQTYFRMNGAGHDITFDDARMVARQ